MKKQSFLIVLILLGAFAVYGQRPEWKKIYSDEFHFIASFPGDPRQIDESIDTSFGKASARRWILELPGTLYEITVADIPDLSVNMDVKSLISFYKAACIEFNHRTCNGSLNDDQFGERGSSGGFRTEKADVSFLMYLTGRRFYIAKATINTPIEDQLIKDGQIFLDEFLFTHVDEKEKKLKWGIAEPASQNRKKN